MTDLDVPVPEHCPLAESTDDEICEVLATCPHVRKLLKAQGFAEDPFEKSEDYRFSVFDRLTYAATSLVDAPRSSSGPAVDTTLLQLRVVQCSIQALTEGHPFSIDVVQRAL